MAKLSADGVDVPPNAFSGGPNFAEAPQFPAPQHAMLQRRAAEAAAEALKREHHTPMQICRSLSRRRRARRPLPRRLTIPLSS